MRRTHIAGYRPLVSALLAAVVVSLTAATSLAAEEPRVLRVAFPEADGYSMISPDGEPYGLVVDYLSEIAKYTGWKYEYITMPNDEVLDRFLGGEFDLMGGQYYMDGLEEYFAYPDYNCGYSKLILLARQGDERIKGYDLSSFNGKTIGVFERAKENIRRLQIYLDLNALDCTLKYYTYDDLMETGDLNQFLEKGEVDLLLGNSAASGDRFYIAASFDSQPHYIVTQAGDQEVLDGLNMALDKIYGADPLFAKQTYEKNFPAATQFNIQLNAGERAYVEETGTVTVAVPEDWHPLYCLNNTDGHDGVAPDILQKIEDYSGLSFSYLHYKSYAEAQAALQRGEADVLAFYLGSEKSAAESGMALTMPYTALNSILVRNRNVSYPADGLTGAILEGRELPDYITAEEVIPYSNAEEALSDVNRGKVDFYYGIAPRVERLIQENTYTNLVQVNLINDKLNIAFAVDSPVQPELFSILNKGVNSISEDERSLISSRSLVSIGNSRFTLSGLLYANPGLVISTVTVFLILVLLAVILVSRSRIHAAAMRSELDRAEADSRAKGEFLSRMSHELRTPMNAIVGLADLAGMTEGLPEKTRAELAKIKSSSKYLLGLINDILDMSRIESGKMEIASEPFSLGGMLGDIQSMLAQEAAGSGLAFTLERAFSDDVLIGDAIRLRQVLINLLSNAFKFTPKGGRVTAEILEEASTEETATITVRVTDSGIGISPEDQRRIFQSFEQVGSNYAKSQGTGLGLSISRNLVHLMGGELLLRSEPGKGSQFSFTITLPKGRMELAPDLGRTPEEVRLDGICILLAEDNDLNAEIAMELLRSQGVSVWRAENGRAALDLFQRSRPGEFDGILMDIMMPEMNGLEAAAAIRALDRPDAGTIPIIAMTANAFEEDKNSALAAGMTGFIPKPVDIALLFRELSRALSGSQRA